MPSCWKGAVILPFNETGKDPVRPGNYRPVALTSLMCKWMEKIIVRGLSYVLEQRGLLSHFQSGRAAYPIK